MISIFARAKYASYALDGVILNAVVSDFFTQKDCLIFRLSPSVERRRRWESGGWLTEYGVVHSLGGGRGVWRKL